MPKLSKLVNRGGAGIHSKPDQIIAQASVAPLPTSGKIDNIDPQLLKLAIPITKLVSDPLNCRQHGERNMDAIKHSLMLYGQKKTIVVRKQTMVVVAGNGTLQAARELGWTKLAANVTEMTDAEAAGYGLADNRSAELASWDFEMVKKVEKLLQEQDHGMVGWTLEELTVLRAMGEEAETPLKVSLADRFLIPPFSVLDARQGYWQDRKRAWLALGIKSELGRGDNVLDTNGLLGKSEQARSHYKVSPGGSPDEATRLGADGRTVRGDGRGKPLATTFGSGRPGDLAAGFKQSTLGAVAPNQGGKDGILTSPGKYAGGLTAHTSASAMQLAGGYEAASPGTSGTSIFDPVLCELAYRWFCPLKGKVIDPFAGGSVRGIVAAKLGRQYTGIELNPAQIVANEEQAKRICPDGGIRWVAGDAKDAAEVAKGKYDMAFSCPPYADLERYSDDPRDLSTMPYDEFLEAYSAIIKSCCDMLLDNRFAVFVVGDIRNMKDRGVYRSFPADTVNAFAAAGLDLYNEAVLVTAVGSLPIRVGRQFAGARKLGRTHQNVLVFVKGDPVKAVKACGPVEVCDLAELLAEGADHFSDGAINDA